MRHRSVLVASLLVLALLGAGLQASLAAAAPGWVAPEPISDPGQVYAPKPAIDDRGNAVAVWGDDGIALSTHPPGGEWTPPTKISSGNSTSQPAFAMNGAGEAVIAWVDFSAEQTLRVVTRAADGSLSAELALSASGQSAYLPTVAINNSGAAVVSWVNFGSGASVQVSTRPPGGDFSAPVAMASTGIEPRESAVAIDGAGAITLIWVEERPGVLVVELSTRAAGDSSFSPPQTVSEEGATSASWITLAVNDAGDAVILWRGETGAALGIHAVTRIAGGAYSAPVQFPVSGEQEAAPHVAIDAAGEATLAWSRFGGGVAVRVATWSPSAGFSAPFTLSGPEGGFGPSVVCNASGETLVVWEAGEGSTATPMGSWKSRGGELSPPVALGPAGLGAGPMAAIAADGNGLAVWSFVDGSSFPARAGGAASAAIGGAGAGGPITRSPSADSVVTAAGFDATPPALSALGVPSSGTVGAPVSFTAAATDVWDRHPVLSFEFGDGAAGSGEPLSHTYGQPGTYAVKAFATNSVGSTSAPATRSITITAAPGTRAAVRAAHRDRVRIALRGSRQLPIADGAVELRIENTGDRPVRGTLNLWTTAHLGIPLPASVGKQGYSLAAGRTATVRVELSQRALELIGAKRIHRLAAQADATFRDARNRGGTVERRVELRG